MALGIASVLAGVIVWALGRKRATTCAAATAAVTNAAPQTVLSLPPSSPVYSPTITLAPGAAGGSSSPLRSILRSPGAATAARAAAAATTAAPTAAPSPPTPRHVTDSDSSDSDSSSSDDDSSSNDEAGGKARRRRRRRGVQWADGIPGGSNGLARVRQFDDSAPSIATSSPSLPDAVVADHLPKPVPALLPAQRAVLAYESAMISGTTWDSADDFRSAFAPDGGPAIVADADTPGPVFYSPPTRFVTVDQLASERERFLCRPDTPELDRVRRTGALREIASIMKPDRDGTLIPIAIPAIPAAERNE